MKDTENLDDISFPSLDLNAASETPPDTTLRAEMIPDIDPNQLLVEGVAELADHPQIEPFLKSLYDLNNELIAKVIELSKDSELVGSVKVLFAVREKKE